MAVLIEAYSVVMRGPVTEAKWPGNWPGFMADLPNKTMCTDGHLVRVGFMNYNDALEYCALLESYGIIEATDTTEGDYVIVSQVEGPKTNPDWLEFGHVAYDKNPDQMVAACRLKGDDEKILVKPEGWHYEGSLSAKPNFVSKEEADVRLERIRRRDGVEIYYDKKTRKQVFVGRTGDDTKKP